MLDHIELAKRIDPPLGRDALEPRGVPVANVLHVTDPVVGQADPTVFEGRDDAAALRMADDDDVAHLQHVGSELDHRQAVEVGMGDDVGDVAMHEELARLEVDELVGWHAAVGAADPQVARRLLGQQACEEAWPLGHRLRGPGAVLVEQLLDVAHVVDRRFSMRPSLEPAAPLNRSCRIAM